MPYYTYPRKLSKAGEIQKQMNITAAQARAEQLNPYKPLAELMTKHREEFIAWIQFKYR